MCSESAVLGVPHYFLFHEKVVPEQVGLRILSASAPQVLLHLTGVSCSCAATS